MTMKILKIQELKSLFRDRQNRRGYYDFAKMTLGILASIMVLILFYFNILGRFELTTFDYRMKFRRARQSSEKIVLIDMGEDSIRKIGRWPWPREWHATMISVLSTLGAKAVVFDVLFTEPSNDFSDSAMEEAMKKAGIVYIPYAIELGPFNREEKRWNVRNIILPIKRFSKYARGEGHITIVPDKDGTIRKIPIIIEYKGKAYPQIGLRVACNILGMDPADYKAVETPLGRYIEIGKKREKPILIPVNKENEMLVNWAAKWGEDFEHYSYIDVITSFEAMRKNKKPHLDLSCFKDKICIIGLTAAGLYDIKPIPLQPTYPAVGTNANIINSVLNRDFARKVPGWLDGLIILILGIILSINISRVQPIQGTSITVLMTLTYLAIAYAVLDLFNIWISVIYPLATIILGYLVITFYNLIVISAEKAKLFALATKDGLTGLFVIRHFSLLLEAEMERMQKTGGRLSILMSDIDHFKSVNDTYGHQVGDFILKEVAGLLGACCRQFDIPSRYGGEEFIVMLPGADIKDAGMVAERIRKKVETHNFKMDDKTYNVTISLGVAAYKSEDTRDDFVKRTDEALYTAKETGRNKVCLS